MSSIRGSRQKCVLGGIALSSLLSCRLPAYLNSRGSPAAPTCAEASMGQFTRVWSGGRILRGGATRSVVYFRCHTAQISERNCDQVIRLLIDSYRITSHEVSSKPITPWSGKQRWPPRVTALVFCSIYTFNRQMNLWHEQWRWTRASESSQPAAQTSCREPARRASFMWVSR